MRPSCAPAPPARRTRRRTAPRARRPRRAPPTVPVRRAPATGTAAGRADRPAPPARRARGARRPCRRRRAGRTCATGAARRPAPGGRRRAGAAHGSGRAAARCAVRRAASRGAPGAPARAASRRRAAAPSPRLPRRARRAASFSQGKPRFVARRESSSARSGLSSGPTRGDRPLEVVAGERADVGHLEVALAQPERGAGELIRGAAGLRALRRRLERLPGVVVAGVPLDTAEREQHLAAPALVRLALEQLQRPPEVHGGLVVGELLGGPAPGLERVPAGGARPRQMLRLSEVVGELGGVDAARARTAARARSRPGGAAGRVARR